MLRLFRVDEAHEIQGLDVVKHNEPAYPTGKDIYTKHLRIKMGHAKELSVKPPTGR